MQNKIRIVIPSIMLFVITGAMVTAQAQPYEGYFSGNIGLGMMADAELSNVDNPGDVFDLGYDNDVATSVAIGLTSLNYRSELEVSYQKNDLNNLGFQGISLDPATIGFSGDTSTTAVLVNAYYDFDTGNVVRPYITGGLGFSSVELEMETDDGTTQDSFSDVDTAFAFQLGAGLGYAVTDTITLDLRYRYFSVNKLEFESDRFELNSHNVLAGIRIKF